jgi:hypothetical protein
MMAKTLSSKAWDGHYGDRDVEAGGMLERRRETTRSSNGEVPGGVFAFTPAGCSSLRLAQPPVDSANLDQFVSWCAT